MLQGSNEHTEGLVCGEPRGQMAAISSGRIDTLEEVIESKRQEAPWGWWLQQWSSPGWGRWCAGGPRVAHRDPAALRCPHSRRRSGCAAAAGAAASWSRCARSAAAPPHLPPLLAPPPGPPAAARGSCMLVNHVRQLGRRGVHERTHAPKTVMAPGISESKSSTLAEEEDCMQGGTTLVTRTCSLFLS